MAKNKVHNIIILCLVGFLLAFCSNIYVRATQLGGAHTSGNEILGNGIDAKVGIGGEPQYKLHVFGDVKVEGAIQSDNIYTGEGVQGVSDSIQIPIGSSGLCTLEINNGLITSVLC